MSDWLPLGWVQLKHQKLRLLAAIMGITFAVILICVQLEFREALPESAVRYHSMIDYDLVMLSPKTSFFVATREIPRNRLYQALGHEGVESVTPVYLSSGSWRNPVEPSSTRDIFIIGFDPTDRGFGRLLNAQQIESIKIPDQVIFDRLGRPEYGPVADLVNEYGQVGTKINDRSITVTGLYALGTSFGLDGAVITSDLNFMRAFPGHSKSAIDLGLMQLKSGVDPVKVQQDIVSSIPGDVMVLTAEQFKAMEKSYWNNNTPIGYIFSFGAMMGLVVGFIIVYQILFADVQDHLKEYATLKAMGYTHGYLCRVVLQQALILALLGFIPGTALSWYIFDLAARVTGLPLALDMEAAVLLLGVTIFMCAGSGLLAIGKLRSVDPAEVF